MTRLLRRERAAGRPKANPRRLNAQLRPTKTATSRPPEMSQSEGARQVLNANSMTTKTRAANPPQTIDAMPAQRRSGLGEVTGGISESSAIPDLIGHGRKCGQPPPARQSHR